MARITIPASDEALLDECTVSTFRSGGPGGQHVNKVATAVRLKHIPTGIVVTCRTERSQYRNRQICLERLRGKIAQLNIRPRKRIPTRIPAKVKEKRLEEKERQSKKKQLRRRIDVE